MIFGDVMKSIKQSFQDFNLHGGGGSNKSLKNIRVGSRDLIEECLLSEGGYAYIYKVRDAMTGEIFALKKMICQNPERLQTAKNEVNMLRNLPSHPNIMKFYDAQITQTNDGHIAYILIEFCEGGSVFDLMKKYESTKLNEKQIIYVMKEICAGIKAMHSRNPPITHRDLKIENVLLSNKRFKLCDFGSCSTDYIDLAKTEKHLFAKLEEQFEKNTTLMYRPPEMCDLYMRYIICEKVDIWMLGCILFTMCFYRHPFAECSKLSVVNAAFTIPQETQYSPKLIDLMRIMLTPDPTLRPDIYIISDYFDNYDSLTNVPLNKQALEIKNRDIERERDLQKYTKNAPKVKKFDGDIPLHELQKLQASVARDQNKKERPQSNLREWDQVNHPGIKVHGKPEFEDFNNFGNNNQKDGGFIQKTNLEHFHSSPGFIEHNKGWGDFSGGNNNNQGSNNKRSAFGGSPNNDGWGDFQESKNRNGSKSEFNSNHSSGAVNKDMFSSVDSSNGGKARTNSDGNSFNPFEAFGFNSNSGSNNNQSGGNSGNKNPQVQARWDNFDFGNAPQNNNNWGNNNNNNQQGGGIWGKPTATQYYPSVSTANNNLSPPPQQQQQQQQQQNMNRVGRSNSNASSGSNQGNNNFGNFGSNSNQNQNLNNAFGNFGSNSNPNQNLNNKFGSNGNPSQNLNTAFNNFGSNSNSNANMNAFNSNSGSNNNNNNNFASNSSANMNSTASSNTNKPQTIVQDDLLGLAPPKTNPGNILDIQF